MDNSNKYIDELNKEFNTLVKNNKLKEAYKYLVGFRDKQEKNINYLVYIAIMRNIFNLASIPNQNIVPLIAEGEEIIDHYKNKSKINTIEIEFIFQTLLLFLNLNETSYAEKMFLNIVKMSKKFINKDNADIDYSFCYGQAEYFFIKRDYSNASKFYLKITRNFSNFIEPNPSLNMSIKLKLFTALEGCSSYKHINKNKVLLEVSEILINNGIKSTDEENILHYLIDTMENRQNNSLSKTLNKLITIENECFMKQKKETDTFTKKDLNNKPPLQNLINITSFLLEKNKGDSTEAEANLINFKDQAENDNDYFFLADVLYTMYVLYNGLEETDLLLTVCFKLKEVLNREDVTRELNVENMYLGIAKTFINNKELSSGKECLDSAFSAFNNNQNQSVFLPEYHQVLGLYFQKEKKYDLSKRNYLNSASSYLKLNKEEYYYQSAVSYLGVLDTMFESANFILENFVMILDKLYSILTTKCSIKHERIETYAKTQAILTSLDDKEKVQVLNKELMKFYE